MKMKEEEEEKDAGGSWDKAERLQAECLGLVAEKNSQNAPTDK